MPEVLQLITFFPLLVIMKGFSLSYALLKAPFIFLPKQIDHFSNLGVIRVDPIPVNLSLIQDTLTP
jgi:hypothetical protein